MPIAPALGLDGKPGLLQLPRAALGPFFKPLRKVSFAVVPCKNPLPQSVLGYRAHARQHMHMKIPLIPVAVRPVNVSLSRNALAQELLAHEVLDDVLPLRVVKLVGQGGFEAVSKLGVAARLM